MGVPVIIYGKSGSGKSRSLKFFGEDEILYVNIENKPLPFKNVFKYQLKTEKPKLIMEQLGKMPMKTAVIDDLTYIMVNNFMRRHRDMKGNAQFELYNDIADYVWSLFEYVKHLPDDVIVYFIMHEESNDYGQTKIRTIGKLLDDKVVPEGIVTICLRCMSKDGKHYFKSSTDGTDITKAPEDLFEEDEFENNLKFVDDKIREFYGLNTEKEKNTDDNTNA